MRKQSALAEQARRQGNHAALSELYRILDFGPVPEKDKAAPELCGQMQHACALGRASRDPAFATAFAAWREKYPDEGARWAQSPDAGLLPLGLGAVYDAHIASAQVARGEAGEESA